MKKIPSDAIVELAGRINDAELILTGRMNQITIELNLLIKDIGALKGKLEKIKGR